MPPGTNRRSHFKTLKKLWRWAYELGHVELDPMARTRSKDAWGINNEYLSIPVYARILSVVAGLTPPVKGRQPTDEFKFLLPYFVLGGLAGLRTCELARSEPNDPVLEWEDIDWNKCLITVPHEVAKKTRSLDRKRYVPIEPAVAKILQPLAGQGPVISCCDNHFFIRRRELKAAMKIKLPKNCLRNSYATYALTFRSLGDVAKAIGGRGINREAKLHANLGARHGLGLVRAKA